MSLVHSVVTVHDLGEQASILLKSFYLLGSNVLLTGVVLFDD